MSRGSRLKFWKTKPIFRLRRSARSATRQRRDVLAVEPVSPRGRPVERAEQVDQRRLARARRPHQRDHLAALDRHRDPLQHGDLDLAAGVLLVDRFEPDEGHGRFLRLAATDGDGPPSIGASVLRLVGLRSSRPSACAAGTKRRPPRPGARRRPRRACPRRARGPRPRTLSPSLSPTLTGTGRTNSPCGSQRTPSRVSPGFAGFVPSPSPRARAWSVRAYASRASGATCCTPRLPPQGRLRHEQHALSPLDLELEPRRQVRQQPAARVVDGRRRPCT